MAVKRTSEVIRVPLADSTNNNTMSEVVAKVASSTGSDTVDIAIFYHTY